MRYIPAAAARECLDVKAAIEAVAEAYRLYGTEREVLSRPSAALTVVPTHPPRSALLKGATLRALGVTGHSFGMQFGELYFALCDSRNGELLALLDQLWLTSRRTGATAAVAALHLAPADARIAALVGAGRIGEQIVRCLDAAMTLDEIRVASRTVEGVQAFVARLQPEISARLTAASTPQEAVRGADIAATITFATEPLIHACDVKSGALILAMGGAPEIAFGVLSKVDRLVVDDLGYALMRGTLAAWIRDGRIEEEALRRRIDADIGEVVAQLKPGRVRADGAVLAVIQGMAVCDLVIASRVLKKAREKGLGVETPLTPQAEPVSAETLAERTPGIVAGLQAGSAAR